MPEALMVIITAIILSRILASLETYPCETRGVSAGQGGAFRVGQAAKFSKSEKVSQYTHEKVKRGGSPLQKKGR